MLSVVPSAWWLPIDKSVAATSNFTAPQNVAVTNTGTVTWTAPAVTTGITSYQVEYSTDGTNYTVSSNAISSLATSYSIPLGGGSTYYIRIAAVAGSTVGPYGYPWKKLYSTVTPTRSGNNIVYESGFGTTAGDAYSTATANFTRVRYRMQYTVGGVTSLSLIHI